MNQDVIWEHFQNEGVEAFANAAPRLEFLVRKMRAGERVLNVGVGSGVLEALAARKGVEVWALDPSERSIAALRDNLGIGDHARSGYGQDMPFDDDHFDTVVMTEVIEHLENDVRDQTLGEVVRVLKPGGRLIGTVPAREVLAESEVVCPHCSHHFHRWGHHSSYDRNAMAALLRRYLAVELVEERFFNEWDRVGWGRRATGLLKRFLSWRGLGTYGTARNLYFVARKPAEARA